MSIAQHILFGVDGGGSGCRIAAVDQTGHRIGEASGGPANVTTDQRQALANLRDAIARFASDHELSDTEIKSGVAHIGLAGVITQEDKVAVAKAMPFAHVAVSDDCETALVGALEGRFGVLAAIGTGTIIAAQSAKGIRRFGGWGLQISDQASGAWLGREVLKRSVLAQDGLVAHSDLTRSLMAEYNNTLTDMVAFALTAQPSDYALHAPAVIDAAQAGDDNGLHLMHEGAAYLTDCFNAAQMQDDDLLCLSAGVGPHYAPYLEVRYQDRIKAALGTSLDGALLLARKLSESVKP